jgi:hypothetical protein
MRFQYVSHFVPVFLLFGDNSNSEVPSQELLLLPFGMRDFINNTSNGRRMTRLRELPNCRELKSGTYYYSEINLCFLIFSCLIFESSVDRGIPSFAAAPSGPATFPLHSANAVSIISLISLS